MGWLRRWAVLAGVFVIVASTAGYSISRALGAQPGTVGVSPASGNEDNPGIPAGTPCGPVDDQGQQQTQYPCMVFTLTVSPVPTSTTYSATVGYSTSDLGTDPGDATAGDDYLGTTDGSLTLTGTGVNPDGTTNVHGTYPLEVPIVTDTAAEPDEQFKVTLTSNDADLQVDTLATSARGTIVNDDGHGTFHIQQLTSPTSQPEGDPGPASTFEYRVTRDEAGPQACVHFDFDASETATPGSDFSYTPTADARCTPGNKTVYFAAGATDAAELIDITTNPDLVSESDETVIIDLVSVQNAANESTAFPVVSGAYTIQNDDSSDIGITAPPAVNCGGRGVGVCEGAGIAEFTITRSNSDKSKAESLTYQIQGTGGSPATPGEDFNPVATCQAPATCDDSSITIPANVNSVKLDVAIIDDTISEQTQAFDVEIADLSGDENVAPNEATAQIIDNDPLPTYSIAPGASAVEGDSGTSPLTFTVTRSPSGAQYDSSLVLQATGTGSASIGIDYVNPPPPGIPVHFTSGADVPDVQPAILVKGDTFPEPTETLGVRLVDGTTTVATAVGSIQDDDSVGAGSAGDAVDILATGSAQANEGQNMTFSVRLAHTVGAPVSISYATAMLPATAGNRATSGLDYTPVSGTKVINQGSIGPITVSVPIKHDDITEKSEQFDVLFSRQSSVFTEFVRYSGTLPVRTPTFTALGNINADGGAFGYRVFADSGGVYDEPQGNTFVTHVPNLCAACGFGSAARHECGANGCIVGMAPTPDGRGYWLATTVGKVYSFGTAKYHGGLSIAPASQIVGIAATPTGDGYWLVGSDGGVYSFGQDAAFHGSLPSIGVTPTATVTTIVGTPSGHGYWIVTTDGGVFSFGDARYHGSFGSIALQPGDFVSAMARTSDGGGYWLATAQGGVFAFGDATYYGNAIGKFQYHGVPACNCRIMAFVSGIAATYNDDGYVLVTSAFRPELPSAIAFGGAPGAGRPPLQLGFTSSEFVIGVATN